MKAMSRLPVLLALSLVLSGCVSNAVRLIPAGMAASNAGAVVIYGVGVEGNWKHERFGIELAAYDLGKQALAGNCFRFDRTRAKVPAASGPIQYFAFEVPPGNYVYSPFNSAPLAQDAWAFAAPEARTVYIGDFVYARNDDVVIRRDPGNLQRAHAASLPDLKGEIVLATAVPVRPPAPFLCTP